MADFGKENSDPVVEEVRAIAKPIVDDLGYELVEVQFKREQHGQVLRIVIYRESGVGIDDCAKVSREVSHLLEIEDRIDQAYYLEVTSPGLDWRLRNVHDFIRFKGKLVRVVLLDEPEALVGRIGEVDSGMVGIDTEDGETRISLDLIKKAKLVIEF